MKYFFVLILFIFSNINSKLIAQSPVTHSYLFNSTLTGNSGSPTLSEVLSCGANLGSFGTSTIVTTSGSCGNSNTFCFEDGGGLSYPNGNVNGQYTINMFFKLNSLSNYSRLVDFSNSTSDAGIYLLNNCLNFYPNGNIGTCPYFNPNVFYLLTLVRESSSNIINVYVDGVLFGTYTDASNLYSPPTSSSPIVFFRDDNSVPCESAPGCIKYLSVSTQTSSAFQVDSIFNSICTTVNPCLANAGNNYTICANQTYTLGGNPTASGGSGIFTYSWAPTSGLNNATLANPTLTSNISSNIYTVTIDDGSGCITTSSISVSVSSPTLAINSGTICNNDNISLLVSGANTYTWSPPNSLNTFNGNQVTASPSITTIYTVTGTNSDGCSTTITTTVTVNPIPIPSFTNNTVCMGSNTTFTNSSTPLTGPNAITNWLWDFDNDGNMDNFSKDPNYTFPSSGTYTTNLYAIVLGTGCSANLTQTVQVLNLPTLSVFQLTPPACSVASRTLIASGATNYTWSPSIGISGTTGSVVTSNPSTTSVYQLTGELAGCSNTITTTVVLNTTISAVTSQTDVSCYSLSDGSAEVQPSGGLGTYYYTWYGAATTQTTQSISGLIAGNYSVVITNTACSASGNELVLNGDFELGNSSFSSDYNYTNPTNTAASEYNVGNANDAFQWNNFFTSSGDHTSGNGKMLLVNGSGTPGSNVFCQTLPVNPNSNYNFSTWVSTLNSSSPALLQFYVNGIALGPIFSAPTTTNNWVQFFEVWNSGASTSANICIVNQNTTLSGNDFAIDDVSFQECLTPCPITKTITITEPPQINIAVSSVSICLGSSGNLTASGATTYTWNDAFGLNTTIGTTIVASPTITSSYTVTGSNPNGCSNIATTTVVVNPVPSVYAINTNSKCDTTKIDWMSFNNVTANSGTGAVGGYSINVTQTNAGLFSHSGMYAVGNFPTQYSVASIATTLANNQAGLFTFCFNEEVINPQICLSSIGQGGLQVPVNTSAPYEVVWSGINMQYPTNTQFIGEEGYTIIKFPGRHTCISFDYLVTENYCTIGFGLLDVSCQKDTICPNDAVAFLAKGANTYIWSNGATTNTVVVYPTATSLYTVTGSNNYGCTNSTVIGVEVYTINPVIVNSPSICIGQQTATLTASGAITFTWNNASTLSSPTGSMVLANPNSSTDYTISGTDKNACVITTTSNVHVFPLPNITVSSSTICLGNGASLNATGANTYTWSSSTTLNSASGATVISTTTVNTSYTVTATDINTCVNSNTTNVIVNPLPIITVTSNTICVGQAGVLTASGASTYTWVNASSLTSPNGNSVTANPIVTTNYTVTATDLNSCVNTETTSVIVNNLPIVSVTPSFSMCSSNTGTLTANGADTYTWSPSITLSSSTGSVVNANQAAIQSYTVIGQNAITTCTNSAVTTISITTTPTIIAVASPSLICPQQSSTLTASGANNYVWLPFFTLGNSVIASPTVNTTYTVIGANGSCTNTALVAVSVTVNPIISVTTETICSGNSASLTASGGSSYSWTPANYLSSTTGNALTSNAPSSQTYSVTGISPLGCKTTVSVEVTVVTTPTLNVVGNPLTICTGSNSILTVNGANSFTWSPSATLDNTNNSNVTATPISTTIYTVTGENNLGNISCYNSRTIQIIVKPKIVPILSPNQEMCEGQSTKIYAKGGNVYQWQPSIAVSKPNDSITFVKPNVTTIFTVSVSYNNLCPETGTVEVIVNPLPIIDAGKDSTINIDESIVLQGTGDVPVGFLSTAANPLVCNYCPIVEVFPKENTCYTLEGYSNKGCRAQDVVCITITKDWDIYIPNAFTPNGDAFNEMFLPQGYGITQIDLQIFDRWGNMMFYEKDTKMGWDGKNKGLLCEQGIYVYKVFIYAMSGEAYSKTGHVTLLGKSK